MIIFSDTIFRRVFYTHSSLLLWSFKLLCLTLTALLGAISFYQCWPYKDPHWLVYFRYCPRIIEDEVERRFHRWGLGKVTITWLKCWGLRGWYWSIRTVNSAGFWYSQLKRSFPSLHFAKSIKTRHQQLYLPCLNDNRFKSNNKRVFEPSGLV